MFQTTNHIYIYIYIYIYVYIMHIYIYIYIYTYIDTYTAGWDITPLFNCSLTWEINRVLAPGSISMLIFPCWKFGEKPTMPIYSHHFRYIIGYLRVYRVYPTSKHTSFCHVLPISSRRQVAISIMFLHQTWFPNRKWHLLESPPSHFPGRSFGRFQSWADSNSKNESRWNCANRY